LTGLEAIPGRRHFFVSAAFPFYNTDMKNWDVIVIGGGIIGLSLSIELRKKAVKVLVIERGEPGREASHAAGGMLVDCPAETPCALQALANASASMYPEFVYELQAESGKKIDLRNQGTILFPSAEHASHPALREPLIPTRLSELEPALAVSDRPAFFLKERSVDPRDLVAAAWQAAKRRGVDFSSGDEVTAVNLSDGRVGGVTTVKTSFLASKVVNCAGAWSGALSGALSEKTGPQVFPTRPVKGQMLCMVMQPHDLLKHVIRSPELYLIPRSDGRLVIGTTVEEAGFDKRVDADTIQHFHGSAMELVPELRDARILESWAGLRPGTPDGLPILGATETPGYYVATGHFRDGILLAPITAKIMADVVTEAKCEYELRPFSASRFCS
jgi:glycine oxidase